MADPLIGDKIYFDDENGCGHFGRIYHTDDSEWIDYYCFDAPDLDGTLCDDYRIIDHEPTSFPFTESIPIRLFETKEMPLIEWLNCRRRGITGTESSAIMGFNKYNTPLNIFKEKQFAYSEEGTNRPDNNHMRLGRDMEDTVAQWFMRETGKKLIHQYAILQHPHYEWMLANIDRKVVGEKAICELKIANQMFSAKEWGKSGTDEVPMHYLIQVYHYMIVCGVRTGYLGVIFTDTRQFNWYKFKLSEGLASVIIASAYDFWMYNHLADKPPEAINENDLAILYPESTLPSIITNQEMTRLCMEHETNRREMKKLEESNNEIILHVGQFIGQHRELLVDETRKVLARFNKRNGRNICDFEKLQAEFPDAFAACVKKSQPDRSVKMNWRTLQSMIK